MSIGGLSELGPMLTTNDFSDVQNGRFVFSL